jgi:hypothetical protein
LLTLRPDRSILKGHFRLFQVLRSLQRMYFLCSSVLFSSNGVLIGVSCHRSIS